MKGIELWDFICCMMTLLVVDLWLLTVDGGVFYPQERERERQRERDGERE